MSSKKKIEGKKKLFKLEHKSPDLKYALKNFKVKEKASQLRQIKQK